MDEPKEYRKELEQLQLGVLIDRLICLRVGDNEDEIDKQAKIKYVREEISRRQVSRKTERRSGKRGIQSLDGIL